MKHDRTTPLTNVLSSTFTNDVVVFSHLRWDFVFQRPQHLLTRCAQGRRVFFVEEPIFSANGRRGLDISQRESGVWVVQPHLPEGLTHEEVVSAQRLLVDDLIKECSIKNFVTWYYTPMALSFSRHLEPVATVFDCMDELSLFHGAPKELVDNEAELLKRADVVFTGGQSLYEAKKDKHANAHAFPSSIDFLHFSQARRISKGSTKNDPRDQAEIPHPRMGFFGVIDERLNIELLDGIAEARPDWHLIVIGPVVKIDPNSLPQRPNIHYLGQKDYKELPSYLAGWDVAMMPFAKNDSTRFISPTKTPEYLAAGKPVVSTSINDVVHPYGDLGLVRIADTVAEFIVAAAECGMDERTMSEEWLNKVDAFLSQTSWDRTWSRMAKLIETAIQANVSSSLVGSSERSSSAIESKQNTILQKNNPASASFSAQVA